MIIRKENLKFTEKGVSGYKKKIGFFIVNGEIPEGDIFEAKVIRKIIDKRGKEIPIIKLYPHNHVKCGECNCGEFIPHTVLEETVVDTVEKTEKGGKCIYCSEYIVNFVCYHTYGIVAVNEETFTAKCHKCNKEVKLPLAQFWAVEVHVDKEKNLEKEFELFFKVTGTSLKEWQEEEKKQINTGSRNEKIEQVYESHLPSWILLLIDPYGIYSKDQKNMSYEDFIYRIVKEAKKYIK
ncbi:MAG: hypothetical protein ACPLSA_01745 [Caldanaerobacter sp.]